MNHLIASHNLISTQIPPRKDTSTYQIIYIELFHHVAEATQFQSFYCTLF